jgi:hypothetical protein
MLSLWRKPEVTFVAPPCICDEIEARVREAIVIRDEMATWPTPLEAWKKLQVMPVLELKSEPSQQSDTWSKTFAALMDMRRLPPAPRRSGEPSTMVLYDGVPSSIGLAPSEYPAKIGTILRRANGRYQVVAIPEPLSGRAMVVKVRD